MVIIPFVRVLRYIPVVLSLLLLGAHFLRAGSVPLVIFSLLPLILLFIREAWVRKVFPFLLIGAALFWVSIGLELVHLRIGMGLPWGRLAVILAGVVLLTVASALTFYSSAFKRTYTGKKDTSSVCSVAFLITGFVLAVIQMKTARPMLLLERFMHHGGWIEIFGLALYAQFITGKMMNPIESPKWRKRIWLVFAGAFFIQLLIGLTGIEAFLMSGKLHVPVPAVIIGGPLFRGEGFFMLVLFGATLLLVGPAWCSHLCYFGAFDLVFSSIRKRPRSLFYAHMFMRIIVFVLFVGAVIVMRLLEVPTFTAAVLGIGFGILGIASMLFLSRIFGAMVHCAVICPVGLIANLGGKLSPFRIRFSDGCNGCGACGIHCRMGALEKTNIEKRKVGFVCSLCGDCLKGCATKQLEYGFGPWSGPSVRKVFIVLVVILHTVFLGVARV